MRSALAILLLSAALTAVGSAPARDAEATGRVAFLHRGDLVVLDLASGKQRVVMRHAGAGPVHWSGDGRLVSSGGRIAGGPVLATGELTWAPTGERAAYVTRKGGVVVWSPQAGARVVAPAGWGASSVAWNDDGRLALGRVLASHGETWVWNGRSLRRILRNLPGTPMPTGWTAEGRVVWWSYPNSASLAADGAALYAGRTRIGRTLMYPDYVVRCGRRLALADGFDRYATHGKRILLDGRDVSRDRSRSWVSPSCSADGSTLVAAAGRNWEETRFGMEHRALWQLLPTRRRLTRPPAGWTDENPHVLPDGSVLFVRTRMTSRKVNGTWYVTNHSELERLAHGRVTRLADLTFTADEAAALGSINYYGHYGWPWLIAVAP